MLRHSGLSAKLVAVLLLVFSILGCSAKLDMATAKGTGSFRIYTKSYDKAWDAVIDVVHSTDLHIISVDKTKGYILAQRGISAFSYGENVAIFVDHVGKKVKTRVEVVSKKEVITNIFAPNWELKILEKLDHKMN